MFTWTSPCLEINYGENPECHTGLPDATKISSCDWLVVSDKSFLGRGVKIPQNMFRFYRK